MIVDVLVNETDINNNGVNWSHSHEWVCNVDQSPCGVGIGIDLGWCIG